MNKVVVSIMFFVFLWTSVEARKEGLLDSIPVYKDLQEALKNPDDVVQLVLKKKKYTSIPSEIWSFKNLEYLDLSKNKLDSVPVEIKSLKKLKVLKLAKNDFSSMPNVLYELKNLEILVISDNEIAFLSPAIQKMKSLKYLDLYRNNIYMVPEEMSQMKSLVKMDLRGISLNVNQQAGVREVLPNVKVYFSPPCNCNF